MGKYGSKAARDELVAAMRALRNRTAEGPSFAELEERVRVAEAKLPPLGRAAAEDRVRRTEANR